MPGAELKIRKSLISGRELFVCDNIVDPMMVQQVGNLVRTLPYFGKEKSRPGVPGLAQYPGFRRSELRSTLFFAA